MTMLREISRTVSGKLFLGFWGLSVCVVVAASFVGFLDGEIAGGVAASVLVAGMLTIVSIIISFWEGAKSYSLARLTWLVLAVLALGSALMLLKAGQKDADIVLAYALLILTFPTGFIVGPMMGSALSWDSTSSILIYWSVSVIVGYVQWFVLVPLAIKRVRETREQAR